MGSLRVRLEDDEKLLDRLLKAGIDVAHDCGGKLACSSCRVVIREGLERLKAASEIEIDVLDRAGAAAANARLACQANGSGELVVEIPRGEVPALAAKLPIAVSARAAKHFAKQLANHPGALGVRVSVAAAGCSGFAYRVDPALGIGADDPVFESHGLRIVVDAASLPYLQGASIDVTESGLARRLRFDNPNARQSCGCGESFGV